jgi:hypothetical protein
MPAFKIRLGVFGFNSGQLALQNLYEKVAAATGRFKKPRVNALCLFLDEVEHGLDHPGGGENFTVVCDSLF